MHAVYWAQVVKEARAVESRCDRLQRDRQQRVDRCHQLSEIIQYLQQQAVLCTRQQHQMLSEALTRRGLRALRSCHGGKFELRTSGVGNRGRG